MHRSFDTITAIATPPGSGGIAVLRISGPEAGKILSQVFCPASPPPDGRDFIFTPRYMHYGYALDASGDRFDEVLAVFMPGPHSPTGEDVGEIHCHGGPGIASALLDASFAAGARLAEPGEFTRRAFLNGRMDLAQAEAVAEIISAPTREGVRLAAAKLGGSLSRHVDAVRSSLEALRMQVALAVDFPDEDAELLPHEAFEETIQESLAAISRLLSGFDRARLWREGAVAVLAGRVNVGKSSLMNALLGRERAIVSDLPGTTRDYIEENIYLKGIPLRLIDTAGLRQDGDLVEAEGIRRSRRLAEEADVLLLVLDAGDLRMRGLAQEERDFFLLHEHAMQCGRVLILCNKLDMLPREEERTAEFLAACLRAAAPDISFDACPCFALSAKQASGLERLTEGLFTTLLQLGDGAQDKSGDIAPNLRQARLLRQAQTELEALAEALAASLPPDILSVHLEAAAGVLASVTGTATTEELLDGIFSSFCIGK